VSERADKTELDAARRHAAERKLIEAAKRGARGAFETLYRDHVGKVYGLCLRMTASPATAEDCTQETFVNAWRRLGAFEHRSAFASWLHRIAVNVVVSQSRGLGHTSRSDSNAEEEIAALPDPNLLDDGVIVDLETGIRSLPLRARQALVLVGVYGYSYEEAATLLEISIGTCKSQVHRARQLLGERLDLEGHRL
jgi:RNA polymerase sigma-70 factor (ECF subfamily)